MNELVSIITPVFNGERYIRECIESVMQQDYPHIEHIIVDDGSTDNTAAIIREYAHVIYLQQNHKGATAARNVGIENSHGQYAKFLDADDILSPNAISSQVGDTENLHSDEIVYGFCEKFNESGQVLTHKRLESKQFNNPISDVIARNILTSLPLHRLSALRKVSGFDTRLTSGQEWNLHTRLVVAGYRFVYRNTLIYRYRIHSNTQRISNRAKIASIELTKMQYALEAISNIDDPEVKDIFACHTWKTGRNILATGDKEGADMIFQFAKSISPNYKRFFTMKYKIALLLFGPLIAESILAKVTRLSESAKKLFQLMLKTTLHFK